MACAKAGGAAGAEHGRPRARRRGDPALRHARAAGAAPAARRCTATRCGASCSPSPAPAATSAGCRRRPSATATTSSSTARRSGARAGGSSDWGILMARTNPEAAKHDGISFFLCPMDLPGHRDPPARQMTGGSEFDEVFFTDVQLPADRLLGPLHGGWGVGMSVLTNERGHIGTAIISLERRLESFDALGAERDLGPVATQRLASLIARGNSYKALAQRQRDQGWGDRHDRQLAAQARHLRDDVRDRLAARRLDGRRRDARRDPTPRVCWPRRPAASPAARARCSATSSASACSACRREPKA